MTTKNPSPPPAYTEHAESVGQPSELGAQASSPYPRQPQLQPNTYPHPHSPYVQGHYHAYPHPHPHAPYYAPSSPHRPQPYVQHVQHAQYYGPTPIVQQEAMLLPYFDPRSTFALREAAARAKWRFLLALVWALVIMSVLGVATGAEIQVEQR